MTPGGDLIVRMPCLTIVVNVFWSDDEDVQAYRDEQKAEDEDGRR